MYGSLRVLLRGKNDKEVLGGSEGEERANPNTRPQSMEAAEYITEKSCRILLKFL